MTFEYQTSISLIKEILAIHNPADSREDRCKVTSPLIDSLLSHMLATFPLPQPFDTTNVELRDFERTVTKKLNSGVLKMDLLSPPDDDFPPQLYPVLVLNHLTKHHMVPICVDKVPNFHVFFQRYGELVKSASEMKI